MVMWCFQGVPGDGIAATFKKLCCDTERRKVRFIKIKSSEKSSVKYFPNQVDKLRA